MNISSIAIIGTGNVATHLSKALKLAGFNIETVYGREPQKAAELADKVGATPCSDIQLLPKNADLYVLAIKDSALLEVSALMPEVRGLVVHTSGIMPLSSLSKHKRSGVFYPLQTLSKNSQVAFSAIPILIEATHPNDLEQLKSIATACGTHTLEVDSEKRQVVHLAAVFANNFGNHLFYIAQQILATKNIPFEILQPLIAETARKVEHHQPNEVQTGPAARNDIPTIEMHLKLLQQMPSYRQMYDILSQSIREAQSQTQ